MNVCIYNPLDDKLYISENFDKRFKKRLKKSLSNGSMEIVIKSCYSIKFHEKEVIYKYGNRYFLGKEEKVKIEEFKYKKEYFLIDMNEEIDFQLIVNKELLIEIKDSIEILKLKTNGYKTKNIKTIMFIREVLYKDDNITILEDYNNTGELNGFKGLERI